MCPFQDEEEASTSVQVEEIPLPPPEKRKRFGEKVVTLSAFDDDRNNIASGDGPLKVEFGFKRKVNRGNMRQRTTDE